MVDKVTSERWRKDPANWRWAFFYFNKEDKRIFPPKRSGLGWTINFSNKKSVAVFATIMAIDFVIVVALIIYLNK